MILISYSNDSDDMSQVKGEKKGAQTHPEELGGCFHRKVACNLDLKEGIEVT